MHRERRRRRRQRQSGGKQAGEVLLAPEARNMAGWVDTHKLAAARLGREHVQHLGQLGLELESNLVEVDHFAVVFVLECVLQLATVSTR